MKRDFKKEFFHAITNATEDTSYYSEIYLEENLSTFHQKPFTFLYNLLKIRWYYQFSNGEKELHLKGTKQTRWDYIYYRHKSFVIISMLSKYNCLFTDILGSLLIPSIDSNTLYEMVEQELSIPGFAKIRCEYDQKDVPIHTIYQKISSDLNRTINPNREMELFAQTLLVNSFVQEILESIVSQSIPVKAIIDSSYPPEFFEQYLSHIGSGYFTEILTTGSKQKKLLTLTKQQMHCFDCTLPKEVYGSVCYSSNYDKLIRPLRKKHFSALFYAKPTRFLSRHDLPKQTVSYGQVYRNISGFSLYTGPSHSSLYQTMVLYIAPVIHALLKQIHSLTEGKQVVFLGSDRNLLISLYQHFYGKASVLEWSYILVHPPYSANDWNGILRQMPSLLRCTAEQIAHSFEGELPDYVIEKRLSQFYTDWEDMDVSTVLENRSCITSYLVNTFCPKTPLLLVDLTEGGKSGKDAFNHLHSLYPKASLHYFSWWETLEKEYILETAHTLDQETLFSLDAIFRMDGATLMGIRKQEDNLKFQYLQPHFLPKGAEEHMFHIVSSYIQNMLPLEQSSAYFPKATNNDLCQILSCGRQSIQQLREEFFI